MENKKKIILLVIVLVIIIGIVIIRVKPKNSKNENNETNIVIDKNQETVTDKINKGVVDRLEQSGFMAEEIGIASDANFRTEGTLYRISDDESIEEYEIQVYKIDANVMKRLGRDAQDGEVTLGGEKYWKCQGVMVKLTEDDNVNRIIKSVMK